MRLSFQLNFIETDICVIISYKTVKGKNKHKIIKRYYKFALHAYFLLFIVIIILNNNVSKPLSATQK